VQRKVRELVAQDDYGITGVGARALPLHDDAV
jgi:hypothetical protein